MSVKKPPEINASSMADIAFLLLIFFLVTTTMDVDSGIPRTLPPFIKDVESIEVNKRNVFTVLINSADMLMINGKQGDLKTLRSDVKDFLTPRFPDDIRFPQVEEIEIDGIGKYYKCKGVVSMQNDRGTSYEMYIHVQNELAAAVTELRDELSVKHFGMKFKDLSEKDSEMAKSIQSAIPMSISEAEPVELGGNK